jgi:hypothetical protein
MGDKKLEISFGISLFPAQKVQLFVGQSSAKRVLSKLGAVYGELSLIFIGNLYLRSG